MLCLGSSKNSLVRTASHELNHLLQCCRTCSQMTKLSAASAVSHRAMTVTAWCIWGKISSGKEDCRQHPVSHYKKQRGRKTHWMLEAHMQVFESRRQIINTFKYIQMYVHKHNHRASESIYHVNYLNKYCLCTSANYWLCTLKCQSFSFIFKETCNALKFSKKRKKVYSK